MQNQQQQQIQKQYYAVGRPGCPWCVKTKQALETNDAVTYTSCPENPDAAQCKVTINAMPAFVTCDVDQNTGEVTRCQPLQQANGKPVVGYRGADGDAYTKLFQ
jgi:glutaredoxin